MASPIFISRPPAGFSILAVIRGIQLTFLGAIRALRNPYLVQSGYYRKVAVAVATSVAIQLLLWIPLALLQLFFGILKLISSEDAIRSLDSILDTLGFIQNNVLNVGPFLVTAMRYFRPEMDEMFLMSLKFVDLVYKKKHPQSHREYYSPLILRPSTEKMNHSISNIQVRPNSTRYSTNGAAATATPVPQKAPPPLQYPQRGKRGQVHSFLLRFRTVVAAISGGYKKVRENHAFHTFLRRSLRRSAFSMGLYFLSFVPVLGRLVMPVASFYSFNNVVGTPTAVAIFAVGYTLPRRFMVKFITVFWGGRSLVRELLAPYFTRLPFSKSEREHWYRAREGIMFGFGAVFYLFIKTPFIGIVAYGIAEASTAYLVTKVSEPPPLPPGAVIAAKSGSEVSGSHAAEQQWVRNELIWTNSKNLLSGTALQLDGFGTTPDIVPGAWAASSATTTATELKQEAASRGYNNGSSTPTKAAAAGSPAMFATPPNGNSAPHTPRSMSPQAFGSYDSGLAVGSGYKFNANVNNNPFYPTASPGKSG